MKKKTSLNKSNAKFSTINEHLNLLPEDIKNELKRLRDIILSTVINVRERIAYKICVFSL